MSAVTQDLAHAVRALTRRPAFTAVAVGTIALAIAANTAVFSIVNGVLLRPLPFPRPDELVTLNGHAPTGFYVSTSIRNYRDWRDRNHSFQSYAGFAGWGFTLTGVPGDTHRPHDSPERSGLNCSKASPLTQVPEGAR